MSRRITLAELRSNVLLAAQALRLWTPRQIVTACAVALGFGVLIGIATVLIPNPWFMRDIETVWWNYPVWILTSLGAGMLTATYIQTPNSLPPKIQPPESQESDSAEDDRDTPEAKRSARMGTAGGVLAWFAVGCPVCNKIALLALGYSGAITWFAPVQPFLAIAALLLTGIALIWRLRGQVSCPLPSSKASSSTPARAEMEKIT